MPASNVPRRAARTQQERSAATRAKVIEAATRCVAEEGFRGATMAAIAERTGLSFGAIQHQFGEKDAIFDAVLRQAVDGLREDLAGLQAEVQDPNERIDAFVGRCRSLLGGPTYRALIEIQLARAPSRRSAVDDTTRYTARVLATTWREVFGDLPLPRRRHEDARRFTFVVLSGIAAESMLYPSTDFTDRHLQILQQTLHTLLRT